jgi:O-acetyl-ADP-ribose deacetylase (regulator of RNase III)
MVEYIDGDLLQAKEDIISHGVNCRGAFGSGIAGQLRKKYPSVYQSYARKYTDEGWQLGEIQIVETPEGKLFANLATQDDYGTGLLHADYDAIKTALNTLFVYAYNYGYSVALPRIGCGLAGGDWNKVRAIIEEVANLYPDLKVVVYTPEKISYDMFKLIGTKNVFGNQSITCSG